MGWLGGRVLGTQLNEAGFKSQSQQASVVNMSSSPQS